MWITLFVALLQQCGQAVDNFVCIFLHPAQNVIRSLFTKLSTAKKCAALPSIPTMFEHDSIITPFGHSVKTASKDPDSSVGIFLS